MTPSQSKMKVSTESTRDFLSSSLRMFTSARAADAMTRRAGTRADLRGFRRGRTRGSGGTRAATAEDAATARTSNLGWRSDRAVRQGRRGRSRGLFCRSRLRSAGESSTSPEWRQRRRGHLIHRTHPVPSAFAGTFITASPYIQESHICITPSFFLCEFSCARTALSLAYPREAASTFLSNTTKVSVRDNDDARATARTARGAIFSRRCFSR